MSAKVYQFPTKRADPKYWEPVKAGTMTRSQSFRARRPTHHDDKPRKA